MKKFIITTIAMGMLVLAVVNQFQQIVSITRIIPLS